MTHATSRPHPTLPLAGETLDDRFELRALIGEGGMGHVFRAYDHHAAREVALKLLAPRYLGRPERELRFLREAELGRRARHRNLAEYLDAGRLAHSSWPFVSMELVEGTHLGHRLARGALSARVAAEVARQLAGALVELHRAGVVHRDVTPMNVLVRGDEAVLIDLSHAGDATAPRLAVGASDRLTQPHEVPGTHYYMPREQAWAAPAHRAMDVYALGVTLVEMLTGQAPSGWDRPTFIAMQREGKVTPPRVDVRVHSDVPPELAELAHECTSAEPEDRPAADEIVRRLDSVIARWVVPTTEVAARPAKVDATAAGWSSEDALAASQPEEAPRRRGTMALAVLALLSSVVGAWAVWPRADASEPPSPEQEVVAAPPRIGAVDVEVPREDVGMPESIPDVGTGSEVEPSPSSERRGLGSMRSPSRPRPADTEECARVREQAVQAVAGYDWSRAVALAGRSRCWHGDTPRRRILVQSLFHENRWAECVRAGGNSKDAEVKRWVEFCKRHAG